MTKKKKPLTVSDLASLGGQARASKLGKSRRKAIAASGGKAATAKLTTEERRERAMRGWARKREREQDGRK